MTLVGPTASGVAKVSELRQRGPFHDAITFGINVSRLLVRSTVPSYKQSDRQRRE